MKKFNEFVSENYNVPVVSVDKEKIDLSTLSTQNEINRNLAAVLSSNAVDPYGAWLRVCKIMTMYGINLPRTTFDNAEEGEEVVVISQFGDKFGATVDGTVTSPNSHDSNPEEECYLYYSYDIDESGFYKCFAVVTDAEGLEDLMGDMVGDVEIDIGQYDYDPEEQLDVDD
jgi:hypothetical protein